MDTNMSEPFVQSLQITALGMGLVFAAILLLWGMMNLLTAITADRGKSDSAASALDTDNDLKAQAAAIAVALALAEDEVSVVHPLCEPPTAIVSAWQLGTRTRQLYEKRAPTIKPRKGG
jgi:Na+-transporting methylmalonyl-CoA/oxaloacetate decarboxylase gamma subunit